MSRKEQIEIVEPPIKELDREIEKKRPSWIKRGCMSGCGCLIILLIGGLALLQWVATPRFRDIERVPDILSEQVPIYDESNIESIERMSGSARRKRAERLLSLPRLVFRLGEDVMESAHVPAWENLGSALRDPRLTDSRDLYRLQWTDIIAKSSFVKEHYHNRLKRDGFTVDTLEQTDILLRIQFRKDEIDGILEIDDNPDTPITDHVLMEVYIPQS